MEIIQIQGKTILNHLVHQDNTSIRINSDNRLE